jgi:hypothetical protein
MPQANQVQPINVSGTKKFGMGNLTMIWPSIVYKTSRENTAVATINSGKAWYADGIWGWLQGWLRCLLRMMDHKQCLAFR